MRLKLLTSIFFIGASFYGVSQCANSSNIYSFVYDGKTYEVIRENKTWSDAAACALERGGVLAEINDAAEQNAIFMELNSNAGIATTNTVAPDGGNGSYVWIGGNDIAVERDWIWDGDNQGTTTPFWSGGPLTGNPIAGRYNNFGNVSGAQTEPDDFGTPGQDALAISLNGWPLGETGQWNDVSDTNSLYFIVEYPTVLSTKDIELEKKVKLYPNPVRENLTIETPTELLEKVTIFNALGKKVKSIDFTKTSSRKVDFSTLGNGVYFIRLKSLDGNSILRKIIK